MTAREDQWLARALQHGHVGAWRWNIATGAVDWSDGISEVLSFPSSVETFDALRALVHVDDLSQFDASMSQASTEVRGCQCAFRVHAQDGERWVKLHGRALYDAQGQPLYILGSIQDITEQNTREDAIVRITEGVVSTSSEAFLLSLLSNLSLFLKSDVAFVGVLNEDSSRVHTLALWLDGARGENFSYELSQSPCETVIGHDYCIYPRDVQQLFPGDEALVEMEIEAYAAYPLFDGQGTSLGLITALWYQPAPDLPLTRSALRIFGTRVSTELMRFDVESRQRQSVEALEKNAASLRALSHNGLWQGGDTEAVFAHLTELSAERLETERVSIWLYSSDEAAIESADLYERTPRRHSRGQRLDHNTCPEYFQGLQENRVIAAHDAQQNRYTHELAEGYLIPLGITSMLDAPIRVSGRTVGVICCEHQGPMRIWTPEEQSFVGSMGDFAALALALSERRLLEERLLSAQKMESIGRLAGGIAHDFNNLLTAISGCVELASLQIPDDAKEVAGLLDEALDASRRASDLTRQLLAFARQRSVEPERLDLRKTIPGMITILGRLLSENIMLQTDIDPSLWPVFMASASFEQVLVNLAVNARDAMPRGGSLRISARNVQLNDKDGPLVGDHVRLRVNDTGAGISPDKIQHIFEPFFTTKTPGRGTGLGLATCYGIITQAGGHITVESRVDEGTVFELFFPRGPSTDTPARAFPEKPPASAEPPPRGDERILLVEDDVRVLNMVTAGLGKLGYEVVAVSRGVEALTHLRSSTPGFFSLVVSDVVMPGLQGFELAQLIMEIDPTLPVLLVSGSLEHRDDANLHFYPKPYTSTSLARKIRHLLDR